MNKLNIKNIVMLFVLGILLLNCSKSDETAEVDDGIIMGSVSARNVSNDDLFTVIANMGGFKHDFGVVSQKTDATIGFAQMVVGKEIELLTEELIEPNKIIIAKKIYFDSSELADIATKIKAFEFVYWGDDKWSLKVYKGHQGYEDEFLREIYPSSKSVPEKKPWP